MTISDIELYNRLEYIFKVIIIGDPDVDKTKLLMDFCNEKFTYNYVSTVGVSIFKEVAIIKDYMDQDITVNLMIWDIGAQPQFYTLHRPYFSGADGVVLVFDCMRTSTFSHINYWWQKCIKYGLKGIPRVLIGIKRDNNVKKKITLSVARQLAKKLNAPSFMVSNLIKKRFKFIFHKIAELIYKKNIGF